MSNNTCYLAKVTYDNNGNVTKVVPIKSTSEIVPTIVGISTKGLLSNPLTLLIIAVIGISLLGGKKA